MRALRRALNAELASLHSLAKARYPSPAPYTRMQKTYAEALSRAAADPYTHRYMLLGALLHGDLATAEAVYAEHAGEIDDVGERALLALRVADGDVHSVGRMLLENQTRHPPNAHAYGTVLLALASPKTSPGGEGEGGEEGGALELALALVDDMGARGMVPHNIHYSALSAVAVAEGHLPLGLRVFERMDYEGGVSAPDADSFARLFGALKTLVVGGGRKGKSKLGKDDVVPLAQALYASIPPRQIPVTTRVFNEYLRVLQAASAHKEAIEVWRERHSLDTPLDDHSFLIMLRVLETRSRAAPKEQRKVLRSMVDVYTEYVGSKLAARKSSSRRMQWELALPVLAVGSVSLSTEKYIDLAAVTAGEIEQDDTPLPRQVSRKLGSILAHVRDAIFGPDQALDADVVELLLSTLQIDPSANPELIWKVLPFRTHPLVALKSLAILYEGDDELPLLIYELERVLMEDDGATATSSLAPVKEIFFAFTSGRLETSVPASTAWLGALSSLPPVGEGTDVGTVIAHLTDAVGDLPPLPNHAAVADGILGLSTRLAKLGTMTPSDQAQYLRVLFSSPGSSIRVDLLTQVLIRLLRSTPPPQLSVCITDLFSRASLPPAQSLSPSLVGNVQAGLASQRLSSLLDLGPI